MGVGGVLCLCVVAAFFFLLGLCMKDTYLIKRIADTRFLAEKHKRIYMILINWIKIIQQGTKIEEYLTNQGIRSIGIYGIGDIGSLLVEELYHSKIKISFVMDRTLGGMYGEIPVKTLDDDLSKADMIVVTAVTSFEEISASLGEKYSGKIVSIEDVFRDAFSSV